MPCLQVNVKLPTPQEISAVSAGKLIPHRIMHTKSAMVRRIIYAISPT